MSQLVLASQSESRKILLTEAGYDFLVMPSNIEEVIDMTLPVPQAIEKLSKEKAEAVADRKDLPEDAVIIAADSVVLFEGEIIGKPKDAEDLINTLTRMSGRPHDFITGYSVLNMKGRKITTSSVISTVYFQKLSPQFLKEYAERKQPYTKAGGYSIRDGADIFVDHYEGDYTNIVGLPMKDVGEILETMEIQKRQ